MHLNSASKNFLRFPGTQYLGDPFFDKNKIKSYCDNCLIPGTEVKIYSYYENYTAIGVCQKNYRGILCTECIKGYQSSDNFKCSDCSDKVAYIKQFFFLLIKLILLFYINWTSLKKTENSYPQSKIHLINSSNMMRLLIFYFTLLSIFRALPF